MGYAPTRTQRIRQERRSSKQQLHLEARAEVQDVADELEAQRQEHFHEIMREAMYYPPFVTDEQNREMILRGTNPFTGRNFETPEHFTEYVNETVDLLGPLTPTERGQYHVTMARLHGAPLSYEQELELLQLT